MTKDFIKEVCKDIKPYFAEKLGKYTHKRVSDNWYFHGLGFVREGMHYIFGINVGFFYGKPDEYKYVGMNVLVRQNGTNQELRKKYAEFFREHLKNWITFSEMTYQSERGGIGAEFPYYRKIERFKDKEQIMEFLKKGIDNIQVVFSEIAKNPDGIFDNVLRASPPWDLSLLQLAENIINENN